MRRAMWAAGLALSAAAAGCGDKAPPPPATDPDSVKKAQEQIKAEGSREKAAGHGKKAKDDE